MAAHLCSIAALARSLGKSEQDPNLIYAVERASARFRSAVGHNVTKETKTLVLDPPAGETLLLPVKGVSELTVKLGGIQLEHFTYSPRTGALRRHGGWGTELGTIEVTYTAGTDEVPDDVADAVAEQAASIYATLATPGVQQISQGVRSITFGTASTVGTTQRWSEAVERHRIDGQGIL